MPNQYWLTTSVVASITSRAPQPSSRGPLVGDTSCHRKDSVIALPTTVASHPSAFGTSVLRRPARRGASGAARPLLASEERGRCLSQGESRLWGYRRP